jgi:hypothetical protein
MTVPRLPHRVFWLRLLTIKIDGLLVDRDASSVTIPDKIEVLEHVADASSCSGKRRVDSGAGGGAHGRE